MSHETCCGMRLKISHHQCSFHLYKKMLFREETRFILNACHFFYIPEWKVCLMRDQILCVKFPVGTSIVIMICHYDAFSVDEIVNSVNVFALP